MEKFIDEYGIKETNESINIRKEFDNEFLNDSEIELSQLIFINIFP